MVRSLMTRTYKNTFVVTLFPTFMIDNLKYSSEILLISVFKPKTLLKTHHHLLLFKNRMSVMWWVIRFMIYHNSQVIVRCEVHKGSFLVIGWWYCTN